MRHLEYLVMLALLLMTFSCTSNEMPLAGESTTKISVDDALLTLNSALSSLNFQTKSGEEVVIDDVCTISKRDLISNASDDGIAYVVNFKDDAGFALLAADSSIPDPIIAIVENGRMDKHLRIHSVPDTKGYTSQDTSSLFIEDLLSNYFICNEGGEGGGNGGEGDGGGDGDDDDEEHLDGPEDPGDPWSPGSPEGWTAYSSVSPMVPLLWSQRYPFNENYPIYSGTEHRRAGCVPLAVSMIMTYNQFPSVLTINGNTINWNLLNQVLRANSDPGFLGFDDASDLVYWVGLGCNMTYMIDNSTFAWPEDAKDFLQLVGYTNATNHLSYDADLIIDMLEDSKPVFIAADVHAWVIDGMIRLRKGSDNRDLFHCNWGWGGECNGYYASRAFKSSKQIYVDSTYGDGYVPSGKSFNYNTVFRIITY